MSIQKDRLDDEVERVSGNLNAAMARIDALQDRVDELEDELAEEREARRDMEGTAERALKIAERIDDGSRADGGPGPQDVARNLARDLVVKRTAEQLNSGPSNYAGSRSDRPGAATVSDIQNAAEPTHNLAWTQVDRAFDDLVEDYPGSLKKETDPVKLTVREPRDLSAGLVQAVETSLGRDDLANDVVGGKGE